MKLRVVLLTAILLSLVLGVNNAAVKPTAMPTRTAMSVKTTTRAAANAADAITIPGMLSYQGKLLDASGNPVIDTTYSVQFSLYTVPTGGSPFWSETQTVGTAAGLFSVLMGSVTPIESFPQAGTCYLGMKVAADPELTPRLQIASVAYAFLAHKADTANYALASGGAKTWVRAGGDSVLYTVRQLGIARGGSGNLLQNNPQTQVNFGVQCTTSALHATIGGGAGNSAAGADATIAGGILNQAGGDNAAVGGGCGNIASNSYATVAGGDSNEALNACTTVGGGQLNMAGANCATVGGGYGNVATYAWATVGGGQSNAAVRYYSTVCGGRNNRAEGDDATLGGGDLNLAGGPSAFVGGGYADTAKSYFCGALSGNHNVAGIVIGDSCALVAGGHGNKANALCAAVGGGRYNAASASFATVGGGEEDTVLGKYGFATGLHSVVRSSDTNSVALNGTVTSASRQTRVYTLSQGLGALSIDHPLDPQGRILNQYTVGSSEMVLFYRGAATIGDNGRVPVDLPGYFDALCRNPMVQLTGVGSSDVFVAVDVTGNEFVIGGKPGIKVYWTVTGERKDPVAEEARAGMPVEQTKTGRLAGHSVTGAW